MFYDIPANQYGMQICLHSFMLIWLQEKLHDTCELSVHVLDYCCSGSFYVTVDWNVLMGQVTRAY